MGSAALPLALHLTQPLMELRHQLLQLLLLLQHQLLLELATMVLLLARLMRSLEISRMAPSAQQHAALIPTAQPTSLQVLSPQWPAAPSRTSLVPLTAPWSVACSPVTVEPVPPAVTRLMACATGLVPSRPARPSSSP